MLAGGFAEPELRCFSVCVRSHLLYETDPRTETETKTPFTPGVKMIGLQSDSAGPHDGSGVDASETH